MRLKKLYGRFTRWYVFGKLHDPGIELPIERRVVSLGPVRAHPSRILVTTRIVEVTGVIEGQKAPGLHLSLHARAGAATVSAPARVEWSESSGTGTDRGVFTATLNVPPAASGRINLGLELPDGTHRQHLLARYNQHALARIAGGMYRAFWLFMAREVLPRTGHFFRAHTRQQARRAISRALDTQPYFAAGARHIDVRASFIAAAAEPERPASPGIDIVVPVFNAYEYLVGFFRRLGRTTRHENVHFFIIDDASTDRRIAPFLKRLAKSRDFAGRTSVLGNDGNLGFPGTVNRGLAIATRNAVILNTDIKLPRNWLARLVAPLADSQVASATPFSNRATLVSFPDIDSDNDLVLDLDVDRIDSIFAEVDPLAWQLDLPTGVGFCMALSRAFLDRIGGFDIKAFGRGYGEENDWCQRAAAIGGRNVLVANLFVEHDHGLSYPSEEKKRLLARNLETLGRRHPKFHGEVAAFMTADPAQPLRAALLARLACDAEAGGIDIFIDHALGGGANWYREARLASLRAAGRPTIVVSGQSNGSDLYVTIEARGATARLALATFDELDRLVPAGGHVHWVYNCAVGFAESGRVPQFLARRTKEMGNTLEVAMHDFFPVCPSYMLLDASGVFCGVPGDLQRCRDCLKTNPHRDSAAENIDIDAWRARWGDLLMNANAINAFSQESARLLQRAYPAAAKLTTIQPHAHMQRLRRVASPVPTAVVTIAVIGAIAYAKGGAVLKQAALIAREEKFPVRLIVIGELSDEFHDPAISVTGRYVRTELPDLVEQCGIDIVWFPSVWPETFSYVAEEAMDMGLPIACFNIGAPAQRVRTYARGLVLDSIDARQAVLAMIQHVRMASAA